MLKECIFFVLWLWPGLWLLWLIKDDNSSPGLWENWQLLSCLGAMQEIQLIWSLSCYEEAQAKKVERLCRQRGKYLARPQLFEWSHLRSLTLRNRDNLPHCVCSNSRNMRYSYFKPLSVEVVCHIEIWTWNTWEVIWELEYVGNVSILFISYLIVCLGIEFLVGRISFRILKVLLYYLSASSAAVEKFDAILIHISLNVI